MVIPANIEESDSCPCVEPSMGVIHVGERFLEFASVTEMPGIFEISAGHSEEVFRDLP